MKTNIFLKTILTVLMIAAVLGSSTLTPISAADKSAVEDFVTRFYKLCLNRNPDQGGLNDWVSALLSGKSTGSDVASGFVFSKEFTDKNTTTEEFLQILYEAFFDRQPDAAGLKTWLDAIAAGSSRRDVLSGFVFAAEFEALCDAYGIKAHEGSIDDGPVNDANKGSVDAFVTRFYQLCLGRDPDTRGLEDWSRNLLNQTQTGADVARGFIGSKEFIDKNTTNEEYLTILYNAFFNRDPDPAGYNSWIEILNAGMQSSFGMEALNAGKERDIVLDGFLSSQEFIDLCEEYGILPFKSNGNIDNDGDGYTVSQQDCNDYDPSIYPGAPEICGDGIDQDCNGSDKRCTSCIDIDGKWYINETVSLNCCLGESCETETFRAERTVVIKQDGCVISYDVDISRYGVFTRTGVVDGTQVRLSGISVAHPRSCNAAQISLDVGGVVTYPDMKLKGSGIINRVCSDDSYTCTIDYAAELNKTYPYLTMLSSNGQDCDPQINY